MKTFIDRLKFCTLSYCISSIFYYLILGISITYSVQTFSKHDLGAIYSLGLIHNIQHVTRFSAIIWVYSQKRVVNPDGCTAGADQRCQYQQGWGLAQGMPVPPPAPPAAASRWRSAWSSVPTGYASEAQTPPLSHPPEPETIRYLYCQLHIPEKSFRLLLWRKKDIQVPF